MKNGAAAMKTEAATARDDAQIRQLMADQQRAICAKDVDRIMALYANEFVAFDVKPPYRTKGKVAWRQTWEACLPCFPDSFQIETRDLTVAVSGDLAFAYWLFRFAGKEKDHPAMRTWMRITAAYRRNRGKWRIAHEHLSVPFDPETSKAAFTLNP